LEGVLAGFAADTADQIGMDHAVYLTGPVHNGKPPSRLSIGEGAAKKLMSEIDNRTMETVLCDAEYGLGAQTLTGRFAINPAQVIAIEFPASKP
jgi:hypothetical protein